MPATWGEHLAGLEAMINDCPAARKFLVAPGSLFAAIAWLQVQLVRLLVLRRVGKATCHTPADLWYREELWCCWHRALRKDHQEDFAVTAKAFRGKFRLYCEERQALQCLVCLRNMLAHGVLTPYQLNVEIEPRSPRLSYHARGKNTACANCRYYPKKKDRQGRPLSEPADNALLDWDRESVRSYFEDLRTVGSAVGRTAAEMNIKHVDLL